MVLFGESWGNIQFLTKLTIYQERKSRDITTYHEETSNFLRQLPTSEVLAFHTVIGEKSKRLTCL